MLESTTEQGREERCEPPSIEAHPPRRPRRPPLLLGALAVSLALAACGTYTLARAPHHATTVAALAPARPEVPSTRRSRPCSRATPG